MCCLSQIILSQTRDHSVWGVACSVGHVRVHHFQTNSSMERSRPCCRVFEVLRFEKENPHSVWPHTCRRLICIYAASESTAFQRFLKFSYRNKCSSWIKSQLHILPLLRDTEGFRHIHIAISIFQTLRKDGAITSRDGNIIVLSTWQKALSNTTKPVPTLSFDLTWRTRIFVRHSLKLEAVSKRQP